MVMDNIGISIDTVTLDEGGFVTLLLIARHSNMEPVIKTFTLIKIEIISPSLTFCLLYFYEIFARFFTNRDVLWLIH